MPSTSMGEANMNQEELIEKCKLTDEELAKVTNCDVKSIETMGDYEKKIAQAQLHKAIPIIQKAERERMIRELEDKGLGTLGSIYLPADIWQALKREG